MMQELSSDQQVGRAAVKQSSLATIGSIGHELSTMTAESPHKPLPPQPPALTLDLSATTAGLTDSTVDTQAPA